MKRRNLFKLAVGGIASFFLPWQQKSDLLTAEELNRGWRQLILDKLFPVGAKNVKQEWQISEGKTIYKVSGEFECLRKAPSHYWVPEVPMPKGFVRTQLWEHLDDDRNVIYNFWIKDEEI